MEESKDQLQNLNNELQELSLWDLQEGLEDEEK